MQRSLMFFGVVASVLMLASCDEGAKNPPGAPAAEPTQSTAATTPQVTTACAKTVERTIAFTTPTAKDTLIIEALGPDCANPSLFARIFDEKGRLIYANATSGKALMSAELFPPGQGTAQGVAENLYDIGEPNSKNLPEWKAGAAAPAKGGYGAYEVLIPQPAYERLRALNATTLIKRGGGESGTIFIYDPEIGEAVAVAVFAI